MAFRPVIEERGRCSAGLNIDWRSGFVAETVLSYDFDSLRADEKAPAQSRRAWIADILDSLLDDPEPATTDEWDF